MQSGRFGEAQVIPQALDLNFKNWFGNTCASKGTLVPVREHLCQLGASLFWPHLAKVYFAGVVN